MKWEMQGNLLIKSQMNDVLTRFVNGQSPYDVWGSLICTSFLKLLTRT